MTIWNNYRPQRSCGQGNVFTGVCLSTRGGGCLPQCMLGYQTTPPGPGRPPDQADTPQTRQTPPRTRQTPPRAPGRHPPGPGRHPPGPRHPLGPGRPPPDQADTPRPGRPPREADCSIRSTSGRYASYWNAFLLLISLKTSPCGQHCLLDTQNLQTCSIL